MFLFAAFQAHFSKIMLKIYGKRNFNGVLEGKDPSAFFKEDIQLKGYICYLRNEDFLPYNIWGARTCILISSSRNVLAGSFPCVLRATSIEIHDFESELTHSQAGYDGHTEIHRVIQDSPKRVGI